MPTYDENERLSRSRHHTEFTSIQNAARLVFQNSLDSSRRFYKGEKSYTIHDLTDGIYASVNSGYFCLYVRKFYIDKKTGNPLPTHRGVAYNVKEVKILHDSLEAIDTLIKC